MYFIAVYQIAGGGQNISGRVILHVFRRGHFIAEGNTSGRVILHVFYRRTL